MLIEIPGVIILRVEDHVEQPNRSPLGSTPGFVKSFPGSRPYKFIRIGDIHGPKPYKFMGFLKGAAPASFTLVAERFENARTSTTTTEAIVDLPVLEHALSS